jgi:hypothetical protein
MIRKTTESSLDRTINRIVTDAAAAIAHAVRQNIADEVSRLVGSSAGAKANGLTFGGRRKRATILCPVPGCGKPGGGPKWGWFCADHKDLSPADKEKARAARRKRSARAAKAGKRK